MLRMKAVARGYSYAVRGWKAGQCRFKNPGSIFNELFQEFLVVRGLFQTFQYRLSGIGRIQTTDINHLIVHAPHQPDARCKIWAQEQLFTAGGGKPGNGSREEARPLEPA